MTSIGKLLNSVVAATSLLMAPAMAFGLNLSSQAPSLKEDFNSMWDASASEGTLQLPTGWRVDRNLNAPRRVGTWADAAQDVMYQGGVNLASNAKNGTWNFGPANSDRAIGGLSTTVANGTRCVSVMTSIENNDASAIITNLDLSYNIEKYRKGANAAGFQVQLYTSADGEKWTAAGDNFLTFFPADSATEGMAEVPCETVNVADRLRVHVEAGQTLYLAWNISVATGSSPDKAPGLAVDDIEIKAVFAESDPDWVDPEKPEINHSGIYLRGVDGWDPQDEWEFNKLSDTTFELRDKIISGTFKVADANWSASCNYGSNGNNIFMSEPYVLASGSNDNISCGSNAYNCSRILLTIEDGVATLLLEPNESMEGVKTIYMVGDFNGWNYMNTDGALQLDENTAKFSGRVTMTAAADGLSHWRVYQRLGMAGVWGLDADATEVSPLNGSLKKGAKGNLATEPGTYDITIALGENGIAGYTLSKVESQAVELTIAPAETILVPVNPEQVRVLSLNNSLIHYNDQSKMFNDIASAMGKDAEWTKHTLLGKPLSTHWEEGDGLAGDGMPSAKMMVRSQPWSHIILQEQSSLPRTDVEKFRTNVKTWVEYIREYCPNPNAVIILPVNWAYSGDWSNFTAFNEIFLANYRSVADEFGVELCPVMNAYQIQYDEKGADGLAAWFQDDRHPTDMSTYMAACMEYGLIFGVDPATISYHPSAVSDADAKAMREIASRTLNGFTQTVNQNAATINFNSKVKDAFGLELKPADLKFSVDSDKATISDKGVFHCEVPGEYTVTAEASGFVSTAKVIVAEAVTEMPVVKSIKIGGETLTYSQDFNTLGEEAEAALPDGWKIDRTDAPRGVGYFSDASETTTYAGGVNLPSNAKNGVWNFGPDATDRAVGGITTGVVGGTRSVNVYAHLINSGRRAITEMNISYDVEKYRDGNNAAGFTVQMYTSTDGKNWKSAGDDFKIDFPASAAIAGSDVVPMETRSLSAPLAVVLDPACDLYLAWNISVSSGAMCQGAPALAIDNVEFNAVLKPVPEYDYHIYIEDNTGYEALGLYAYGDKEIWGAWPGQSPLDEVTIDGIEYKVFGHNEASGNYNIILNNWNRSLQLPDYAIQGGKDYYFTATPNGLTPKVVSEVSEIVEGTEGIVMVQGNLISKSGRGIKVFDATGRLVAAASGSRIDVSALPAGLYIAASELSSLKFLKK